MGPRRLWKLLSGAALLTTGLVLGVSTPAASGAETCAGDVVVALDVAVWSRPGHDTWPFTLDQPLPPGTWSVQAVSHDEYAKRPRTNQHQEQWLLEIVGHLTLGPTTDLEDGVVAAGAIDDLGTFTSAGGVSELVVRHAAPSTQGGTNSVTAVCVGFTALDPPPPSSTTTTTTPTTTTTSTTTTTTTTAPPRSTSSTTSTTTSTTTTTTVGPGPPDPAPGPPRPPAPPPPAPAPRVAASASVECARGEVLVFVGNQGDADTTVDVALPFADLRSGVAVAAGAVTATTLSLGALEDVDAEVRVSDATTGELYAAESVSIDCAQPPAPEASLILDCPGGVVVVVLTNPGGSPARLTVVQERVGVVDEIELDPAASTDVEIPLTDTREVAIRVIDGDGRDVLRRDLDNLCGSAPPADPASPDPPEQPAPSPSPTDVACDSTTEPDGFHVEVTGHGGVRLQGSARRETTGDGSSPLRILLGAGAASMASGGADPPEGCAELRVILEPDCAADRAAMSIERVGPGRERVVVAVDGRVAAALSMEGTGRGTVPVPLENGAVVSVSRAAADDPVVFGTVSCPARAGPAGTLAASLVVIAVLATAAGVLPRPASPRP